MMRLLRALCLLALAVPVHAVVLTQATGTLNSTAITTATSTPDAAQVDGAASLLIYVSGTAGTTPSMICQQSGDGTNWTNYGSTPATALGPVCNVLFPVGQFRATVTSCTGCSFTFSYRAANSK